jgi:hypothetical protein
MARKIIFNVTLFVSSANFVIMLGAMLYLSYTGMRLEAFLYALSATSSTIMIISMNRYMTRPRLMLLPGPNSLISDPYFIDRAGMYTKS